MPDPIPSTVLAGWLGSGKTTLLNELLAGVTGERLAVIVNDVGEINVDAALIERSDGDRIELTDGCICCSIGSSLALTLRDLVMVENPPDRIVIEASGVAEPAGVARYGDRRRIEQPVIVVTVDATDVLERSTDRRYGRLVRTQVTQADALVITKTDLLDGRRAGRVHSWLAVEAPGTPIIDRRTALSRLPTAAVGRMPTNPVADVSTHTVEFGDVVVELASLEHELRRTPDVLRAKGLLRGPDGCCLLVNFAAGRFDVERHGGSVDAAVLGRLVVIAGTGSLDLHDLELRLGRVRNDPPER